MPDPRKSLVKLAVKFVEGQAQRALGERFLSTVEKELARYAGKDAVEKLNAFFDQGENAAKLLSAFEDADARFARISDEYAQRIRSKPLAQIESLEKLANALPDALDHARLHDELRRRFLQDWRGKITDAQANHAASVYSDCLVRAFALKFGNDLPLLIQIADQLDRIENTTSETLDRVRQIQAGMSGTSRWQRPSAPRDNPGFVGRVQELDAVRKLLAPGTRTAITATVQGEAGIGKTWLALHLASKLTSEQFPGGVIVETLGLTHRRADQCAPILDTWGERAGYRLADGQHLSSEDVRDWLDGHGALFVLLDDVWDADAIQPLLKVIPAQGIVLITTRKSSVTRDTNSAVYNLNLLSPDDALALLHDRMPTATDADVPRLRELASAV